ncbi:protein Iojap-related, mitochondrial isoform X2 [Dendrobium catenatum]|uniref:protein Iojap-related, mitochondrial isoform X2 n=1 Tax=Dendrobium catenatum TaxID=906689 RepID=UPI00109F5131|nr:protein Iojap-related, mitochondrial isoform X2 [Dendrobium catenatum]
MLRTLRHLFSSCQRPRRQFLEIWNPLGHLCTASAMEKRGSLELEEVQKVLCDVKADDVRVIHVGDQCDWTDHIVIATGRSTWHVKNIAQALLHKAKQKQKGADHMMLPAVEGHVGGKWVVIDSGTVIVHALDEKAREYYDLESHLSKERTTKGSIQVQYLLQGRCFPAGTEIFSLVLG